MNRWIQPIQNLVQTAIAKEQKNNLKQRLLKGAAGTLGLRIAATGLNFVTGIILARLLGVEGFGVYTYAFTWTQLLTLGATLGLDKLVVREFAIYKTRASWGLMRGLLYWANGIVLIASLGLIAIAIAIAWSFNMQANPQQFGVFCVAMLLIPIETLRNLRLGAMRGLNKILIGLIPEWIVAPVLLLVLSGCAYLLLGDGLTAVWVASIRVFAAIVTLVIGVRLLYQILPAATKQATPQYQGKIWLYSALPFMFMGSMYMIKSRTDIIMLGAFQGAEAVGIYFAVSRGAQLIDFVTNAANNVLGPNIASLYAEGKSEQIQRILIKSSRTVSLASLPIIIGLVFLGSWYLSLFGSEFTQGTKALIILCVGQIVNVVTGSVGLLLNMTGNERYTSISRGASTILNIILNALLIPRWGLEGAAIATASSSILLNIENTLWVRKKLGIHCSVFGKLI
ncbi:MAG: flippase [Pleurocapsa sp. MO_226.B13]|nr:flippase [Pleurocapsa sp. MO_226.B13]